MSFNQDRSSHRPQAVQARERHVREERDTVRHDVAIIGDPRIAVTSGRRCKQSCSKEVLFAVAVFTTALQGGGLIFGFSAFADQAIKLPGSHYTTSDVTSIFTIGHNITAWGCILSGFILDKFGPRACAVSGLLVEAIGHLLMTMIVKTPIWVTYFAYGLIGLGGCQVLLAALTFADAFKNTALTSAVLTSAFQAGGFVFMLLPFVAWETFFYFYCLFCFSTALLTFVLYPDSPLPSYSSMRENSEVAEMTSAVANRRSLKSTLLRPGTIWFMLTFMIAGSALTYGIGEFIAAVKTKDNCQWDQKQGDFVKCENAKLQDTFNTVLMPLVGNFILPCSVILGKMIDRTGFAFPAFVNIFFVQAFMVSLWLLPLQAQYLTLLIYNVANTAVFTIQNAYICSVGHDHIGALFSISNLVLGTGNLLADWLTLNPFGEEESAIGTSLTVSCITWLILCMPLYFWVHVEAQRQKRRQAGVESFKIGSFNADDARSDVSVPRAASFPLLRPAQVASESTSSVVGHVLHALGRIRSTPAPDMTLPIISFNPVLTVNPQAWDLKVDIALQAGKDKIFCVFDFDRTLTCCFLPDNNRSLDCHDILASIPKITPECKQGMEELMEYYYPIEIHPTMTQEEKTPHMVEWYSKVNMLLAAQDLTRDDVATAVSSCSTFRIRPGVEETFRMAHEKQIPIVIISAGLGNVIEEVIRQRIRMPNGTTGEHWPNVRVLSNTLLWDEHGHHVGFSEPLLHMYNKSLVDAPKDVRDMIHGRHVGILCGDGTGDLSMADGHDATEVLKFAFLNERVEERMPKYIGPTGFDRVILNDGTFETVLELFRRL